MCATMPLRSTFPKAWLSRDDQSCRILRLHARAKLHQDLPQLRRYSSISRTDTAQIPTGGRSRNRLALTVVTICSGIAAWTLTGNFRQSTTSLDSPFSLLKGLVAFVRADQVPEWKGKVYPALTLDEADIKLRSEEAATVLPVRGETGVSRFYSSRLASNLPTEDTFSYESADIGGEQNWQFWGVYDGHAGWATSRVLAEHLTSYVARDIQQSKRQSITAFTSDAVDHAIKTSFLRLDKEIMIDGIAAMTNATSHADALSRIAPARAGSCALLAIFDPTQSLLRIACVGDSRAVLGRYMTGGIDDEAQTSSHWTAEALSEDQTGFNENERKRIESQHPGEADAIDTKTGRLLGFAITRAFGDHRLKWSRDDVVKCEKGYFGSAPRPKYESPPYMTAEPVVTTTKVGKGDFLILASDGFWDHVSTDHAVECVQQWLTIYKNDNSHVQSSPSNKQVSCPMAGSSATGYTADFKGTPEHFVTEDNNVATHLIRNALGGSRRDLYCSVMSAQAPESRSIRDDITVQVVLFGQQD